MTKVYMNTYILEFQGHIYMALNTKRIYVWSCKVQEYRAKKPIASGNNSSARWTAGTSAELLTFSPDNVDGVELPHSVMLRK